MRVDHDIAELHHPTRPKLLTVLADGKELRKGELASRVGAQRPSPTAVTCPLTEFPSPRVEEGSGVRGANIVEPPETQRSPAPNIHDRPCDQTPPTFGSRTPKGFNMSAQGRRAAAHPG